MKGLLKFIITSVTIVAGIATIWSLYLQWNDKAPVIDIKTISLEGLTETPNIDGLKASYFFNDSTVQNLWRGTYIIENIGNDIIVGSGNNKNIITDSLKILINEGYRIISAEIRNNSFPISFSIQNNVIPIDFLQWRQGEYFEIMMYLEGIQSDTIAPRLEINEREILNGKVTYSTLKGQIEGKRIIASYLPRFLESILWWIGTICFGFMALLMPMVVINETFKINKFKIWLSNWGEDYNNWVINMMNENKLHRKYEPENLPKVYWDQYHGTTPDIPSNYKKMGSLILGTIFIEIMVLIPMLWFLKI